MKRVVLGVMVAVVSALAGSTMMAQDAAGVADLMKDPAVRAALDAAKASEAQTIEDQVRYCEVPAPPFKETARGEVLKAEFIKLGLKDVRVDRVGNVIGERPGAAAHPHFVIAAHLDTVFPEGTDVKVKREGNLLKAPGIGDDCRGLAVLTGIVRALNQAKVQTQGSVTFVANVGEEGLGDLRGVKQLFNETMKGQIDRFVSIDGSGMSITNVAVGSHRYKVTFKGPGGHSFGAFGLANPISAMGRAIAKIGDFQVPKEPKTTFNVGRVGGGTSVNSIPFEGWMEIDMRSSDAASLASVDANMHKAIDQAVAEENERWEKPRMISAVKELVGDRPAGNTPPDAPIVKVAQAVNAALGQQTRLGEGSTDSNIPMSMHIPAVTIGGGGRASEAHALSEQFDSTDSYLGTQRAILLTIALSQK